MLSVGAWTVTKTVASALTIPLLTRILGTDGYGQFAYYLALMLLLAPLSNFGAAQSMNRFVAMYPDDRRWQRAVVRIGGRIASFGAFVGAILLVLTVFPGAPAKPSPILFTGVVLGAFLFDLAHWYARGVLYGLQREELAGIPGSIGVVVGSISGVILAWAGLGLLGALLGMFIGNGGVAIATLVYIRRVLAENVAVPASTHDLPASRAVITFGLSAMVFSAINMALYKVSVILLHNLLHDDRQTGLFAAALQMAEFVWIIPLAVEAVMLRLTTPLWVAGEREEISQLLSKVVRSMALLTGWILLPIGMLGDHAMRIYFGEGFIEAAPALQIMVPGVFAYSLSRMLWPVLQGRGNMVPLIAVTGAAATTNVALCWFLIPLHGILGAAISVAVSYGSVVFLYSALLRKEGVHPFAGFPFSRFAAIAALTGMVMLGVRLVLTSHWLILLVGGLAASVVYWLLALRLGVLPAEDVAEILASMPGAIGKRIIPIWSRVAPLVRRISPGRQSPRGRR